ncbi:large ribosomal subunit protein mL40 [Ambystoma mexicanum]|uniref:large ribosomal subunit protein mL40 n=1 Tax=Ambystoma mexicanum TaxID=8296 RepID=UPI0037E8BA7B
MLWTAGRTLLPGSRAWFQRTWHPQQRASHWQTSLLDLRISLPMRAEPKKKKRVDPKRDSANRDRLRKKLKKLERVAPELIPIEDFIDPSQHKVQLNVRSLPTLPFEERERRAVLLKKWSLFKQEEHKLEMATIESLLDAQAKALAELRLESEELYQAAVLRDPGLFPFESQGPTHTPPIPNYEAPEGKYIDITKVYTQ